MPEYKNQSSVPTHVPILGSSLPALRTQKYKRNIFLRLCLTLSIYLNLCNIFVDVSDQGFHSLRYKAFLVTPSLKTRPDDHKNSLFKLMSEEIIYILYK